MFIKVAKIVSICWSKLQRTTKCWPKLHKASKFFSNVEQSFPLKYVDQSINHLSSVSSSRWVRSQAMYSRAASVILGHHDTSRETCERWERTREGLRNKSLTINRDTPALVFVFAYLYSGTYFPANFTHIVDFFKMSFKITLGLSSLNLTLEI